MRQSIWLAIAFGMATSACAADPIPSEEEQPPADLVPLADEGQTTTIDAVDADGVWGTITITRGPDVGGYPLDEIDPETFIVEFSVLYEASRQPVGSFGSGDWALATGGELLPVGRQFEPTQPPDPARFDPDRQALGTWPGATDLRDTPVKGLLAFRVSRDAAAEQDLVLVYRPEHVSSSVAMLLARRAGGDGPEPVPTATPVPTPEPVTYIDRDGAPFTMIDDPRADALFAEPDTCSNPDAGYTVTYPDEWYTNTAIGATPACTWFSPTFYEVTDSNEIPDEIVIVIQVFPGAMGFFNAPDYELNEPINVGGYAGHRHQQVGVAHEGGGYEALPPVYGYTAILGAEPAEGPTMFAWTSSEGVANYPLNKAVLDRIMASIRFDE